MLPAQMNYLFVFLFFCFAKQAWSLGIDFQCPHRFKNGENIVTCRVNRTAVSEAKCLSLSSSVRFERTVYLQTTPLCIINYDPSQPCMSEAQHSPGSCWCSNIEGDIITYSFSYLGNSTRDQRGHLECKTCILPEKPLHTRVNDSCRIMRFDHQITNDTKKSNTTTVTEELNKEDHRKIEIHDSDQPTDPAMIGGIISTAVVLIIVIIVVALFFRNRRHLLFSTKIKRSNMKMNKKELHKMLQPPDEMKDDKQKPKLHS
ncbi:uncharacterized protein LOC112569266 isoform X2 [Pomacea canaliculata]|uniref:uncharacterized protein LOC112569266 isoform X2 n=1 Tax=Pomacea canaliculata TaxID=400727 RepID=UPI000D734BBF|nr:uncharacterized protein LOC112569266 isoform X2 [Pomacea canaliculata]